MLLKTNVQMMNCVITLLSRSASVCTQQSPGVRGMVQSLPDHLGHAPLSHHGVQDCVPAHLRYVTPQHLPDISFTLM